MAVPDLLQEGDGLLVLWPAPVLAADVVGADELMDEAMGWAQEIASNAPLAVAAAKRSMRLGLDAGFEANIRHKLGHGLGLDIHEAPQLMIGNHAPLEPGMVITIEPGLYAPGQIGVRIEDDVLVTEDGSRSFTSLPREPLVVG